MFKKIALIFLFVGVTVGVAYLLYRFFFAGAPSAQPTPTPTPTPIGGLPSSGPGQPGGGTVTPPTGLPSSPGAPPASPVANGGATVSSSVTPDAVLNPRMSASGLNYYDQNDGLFYRVLPNGSKQPLSSKSFPSASDVIWAPAGDKAVLTFPDDSKVLYNFSTQSQVTIPSHWQQPTFNGDGSAVIAKSVALDPDNRWLVSMAADGSGTKLLAALGDNQDKVTVSVSPDSSVVAFSDTGDPVGFDTKDLIPIGQNDENYKALRIQGFGFTPEWSPDGKHLLYSTAESQDSYQPTLWFQVGSGSDIGAGRTNLGVHTWADKCTFANATTVYCAVPDSLPEGAGLQRDIADGTPDHIEIVDLASGTKRTIGRPETDTTIKTLNVSADGSTLFFADANGILKQMRLR